MGVGVDPLALGAVVVVLGLVFGSFLSALTWRLPRAESVAAGRSRCPACGTVLGVRDLVPVISWLAARGRCRHCGAGVPVRYPLIEGGTALLFGLAAWRADGLADLGVLLALATILLALAVIDLEHGLLPNVLNLAAVPPALAWRWLETGSPGVLWGAAGAAAAIAVALALKYGFLAVTGRDGLGLGDVKFLGVAGLILVPAAWPPFLLLAGGGGIVFGVVWRLLGRGDAFPFGPALIAALWAVVMVPDLGLPLSGG